MLFGQAFGFLRLPITSTFPPQFKLKVNQQKFKIMEQTEKHFQYAAILGRQIAELFDEESEFHIDKDELLEGDNLAHFFHALANLMPTFFYNEFTGDDKDNLEFNHIANQLVFQYSKMKD